MILTRINRKQHLRTSGKRFLDYCVKNVVHFVCLNPLIYLALRYSTSFCAFQSIFLSLNFLGWISLLENSALCIADIGSSYQIHHRYPKPNFLLAISKCFQIHRPPFTTRRVE